MKLHLAVLIVAVGLRAFHGNVARGWYSCHWTPGPTSLTPAPRARG